MSFVEMCSQDTMNRVIKGPSTRFMYLSSTLWRIVWSQTSRERNFFLEKTECRFFRIVRLLAVTSLHCKIVIKGGIEKQTAQFILVAGLIISVETAHAIIQAEV